MVRRFRPDPLAEADLHAILEAGRRTGSSKNLQRWHFIVVRERERLRALAEVGPFAGHLAAGAAAITLITPDPDAADSPLSVTWDLGRAAQNMAVVAWARGAGAVPATVYDHDPCRPSCATPPTGIASTCSTLVNQPIPRRSPGRCGQRLAGRSTNWFTTNIGAQHRPPASHRSSADRRQRSMLRREAFVRPALVTCAFLALAMLGGCGGGSSGQPSAAPTSSVLLGPNDTVFCGVFDHGTPVQIKDNAFNPSEVTIAVNGQVDWKNEDSTNHVIKFDNGTTCGTVMAGQTKRVRFSAAGLYPYHCTIHPDMKGTVNIQ